MPPHWTYESAGPTSALEQGDILAPTEALLATLRQVHPHFGSDKYLGYIVTTQSCDLVIRNGEPKAAYINIATIRPLSQVICKVMARIVAPVAPRAFSASSKLEARRFLERLLNQNEQALGLFFLYPDADAGVAESAVAFLRVSIALRSDHHDMLRAARVGRLSAPFQAKLGWLTGNLYGRPATPDWGETSEGKRRCEEIIRQYLDELKWIDDELLAAAKTRGVDVSSADGPALEALRPPSRLERAIDEVMSELRRAIPETPEPVVQRIGNRLRNNGKFTKLFRNQSN